MRWLSLLLACQALSAASSASGSDERPSSCSSPESASCSALPLLSELGPGGLTRAVVASLADAVGGAYREPLHWLATQELFPFAGHDNLTLQAYAVAPKTTTTSSVALVYCAGWTETTVKYASFLRDLAVYSFDFRGQGFSATTMEDGGRVTHIATFDEYLQDLKLFSEFVRARHARAHAHGGSAGGGPTTSIVYVGNSLSGLVGLSTEAQWPGTFARLAVAAPVVKPLATLNPLLRWGLYAATHGLGLGKVLPARLGSDISGLELTHNEGLFLGWQRLRALAPAQLVVQGPSVAWLSALTEQGHALLAHAARRPSPLAATPLLLLVADHDLFVHNPSIFELAALYAGPVRVLKLAGSWHELWVERDDFYKAALGELLLFAQSAGAK